jgi:hypothetical protein
VEHATAIREIRNAYKMLNQKPERKRLLGRHRCRQENNIKMAPKNNRI